MKRLLPLAAALAASGCTPAELPARGQILLHIDTDAPVPPASLGHLGVSDPIPLFDTLRVDVFEPGQTEPCTGCSREFALDDERFRQKLVSFGVPATPGKAGYRVRLRMYPSRATLSGEPPAPDAAGNAPNSVIETTVVLPVTSEGVIDRAVFLATDAVGVPAGSLDAPVETTNISKGPSRVGAWPGAERVPCTGDAAVGEVCIPGGAFWMGNAKLTGEGNGDAADRLRLVVVAPFFLDSTEVTIARLRAAGVNPDYAWSGGTIGTAFQDFCTYTAMPMGREDLPVNCMSWKHTKAFCEAQGGDLPTEAQFEYVASAFLGRLYVWGEDDPTCDDAVLGRGGWGILMPFISPCKPTAPPGGPLVVGSNAMPERRDRIELPGGTVYDLVGNMCEFSRDLWNRQDEACWSAPGVYVDPVCDMVSPADGLKHSYRGGCWDIIARLSTSASREGLADNATLGLIGLGFRCARRAVP